MSALAAIEQPRAPAAQKPGKPARISPAVRKAVQLLLTGECKTQKAAAERAGISPVWLCLQLKKPAVEVFIANEARKTIAQGQMRASARLLELIDASSEHVSLDATKHTLAIGGIRPPDDGRGTTVNVGVSVGYVLDLRPGEQAPSHAAGAQVSTTIEHDEGGSVDNAR